MVLSQKKSHRVSCEAVLQGKEKKRGSLSRGYCTSAVVGTEHRVMLQQRSMDTPGGTEKGLREKTDN